MTPTRQLIDARDKPCPGPLMELVNAIRQSPVDSEIELLSSDPASVDEVPLWVRQSGHRNLGVREENGVWHFIVRKVSR